MPRAFLLLFLGLALSCTKVDTDVSRAKFKEDMADIVKGRDRGYFGYREMIEKATVKGPRSPRYQYVEPAWVSNYMVTRAVRGLGGTKWPNADYTAGSVDRLLYVLHYDPTAMVRAAACAQLGRIARRLGVEAVDPYPVVQLADESIRQIADDLYDLKQRLEKGEKIKSSLVIQRLEELEKLFPTRFLLALAEMRALSSRPVVLAPPGPLRETSERVIPRIARRSISIALSQVSCGSIYHAKIRPDDEREVRERALEVLTALRDPVARDAAASRLWDPDYPDEREASVRMRLLAYLGVVGGAPAFEACVRRLDNDSPSVRFHAQAALLMMTATQVKADPAAWRAWRKTHPEWQIKRPTEQPKPTPATEKTPGPGKKPGG
ncbi:MAG: HEAT repeat domain-containing protein [Planctomycetota bacterium]|jgi:hypothetical protein